MYATEGSAKLEEMAIAGYHKVIKVTHEPTQLQAIIALHDVTLGPTMGGVRFYPYSTFDAALTDVLRLAKGMTYKSALSESGWGGGKSVIITPSASFDRLALLRAFAEVVDRLEGQYICAEDIGTSPQDMLQIARVTPYVVGLPHEKSSGNPSPFTAWGTFRAIQSAMQTLHGSSSVENRTIAIQGLGSVGSCLAEYLFWHGANLILCDIDEARAHSVAKKYHAKVCTPEEVYHQQCDLFSPCAMGGVLNPATIAQLRCQAVVGCANNQLLSDGDADLLMQHGILYAPDFIVNAGGLINVTQELNPEGYDPRMARNKTDRLYDQLLLIYQAAEKNGCSTHQAALSIAEYRMTYGIGKRVTPPCFHHFACKR